MEQSRTSEENLNVAEALAKAEIEKKAYRKVYETIVSLIDPVDEETLLQKLPFLDCNSWKEVVEERFIAKICGFPTCDTNITPKKFQKYCIDATARKVYEVSTDREKYCGVRCLDKSILIMAQLEEQPLWITGDRKPKTYEIKEPQKPSRELKPLPQKKQIPEYEFVPDQIVARLNDLKIADSYQSQSDSDSDDEITIESEELEHERKADDDFIASIRNFVTSKEPKPIEKIPKFETNEEKLARLRNKYGSTKEAQNKRKPLIIDAPIMSPVSSEKETLTAQKSKTVKKDPLKTVWKVMSEWIGEQTKELVNLGGPRLVNKFDIAQLRAFFAGESAYQEFDVSLPPIDSVNVHKRRCEILINQLKKPWVHLEEKLELQKSNYDNLLALVHSFALTADLPIFSQIEIQALVAILFRIVCMLDQQDVERKFFPSNLTPATEIESYLLEKKLNFDEYCRILENIEKILLV